MKENPLRKLNEFGQSVWLDFTRRSLVASGRLEQMIREDDLRGINSNPSIFEKAIAGSHDYDQAIQRLAGEGKSAKEIYQVLAIQDIQQAADAFLPVFEREQGRDGLVSLEVAPSLAHDTTGTISQARDLWELLGRPNVMIKVPGTREGLAAIRQLTSEGINVNVTLLFALPRYREVIEAYLQGLEQRLARGDSLGRIASVASFFLSRIDGAIDPKLEALMRGRPGGEVAAGLRGTVAIASARLAYQIYKEAFSSKRFQRLASQGARPQRLLWASTSTKNPVFSDVKYVEALIGPETVNTMPLETLNNYRDHGDPRLRLETGLQDAKESFETLSRLGVEIDQVTQQLEEEGIQKFSDALETLLESLEAKRAEALPSALDRQVLHLAGLAGRFQARVNQLKEQEFGPRLWAKDIALWRIDPRDQPAARNALGWLHVAEKMEDNVADLQDFAREVQSSGFKQVVHVGMGGSSLAAMVLASAFPTRLLPLTVLDTTDPRSIANLESGLDLETTLFLLASKSGTTPETVAHGEYFFHKLKSLRGSRAGENFAAISDPGTALARMAEEREFRRTFLNYPDIGGRYSALSYFGLVPAALLGMDLNQLLSRSLRMLHACANTLEPQANAGLLLGAVLGEAGRNGKDKVTFLLPAGLEWLGMWLEQLLAESTGKRGKGLLPVVGEDLGSTSVYGKDRLFVRIDLGQAQAANMAGIPRDLEAAGHPWISLRMNDFYDVGQEFLRWEIATATAGSILKINPFDQPNVEESKANTRQLLERLGGKSATEEESSGLRDREMEFQIAKNARQTSTALRALLSEARQGSYFAIQAYLPEDEKTRRSLQHIRLAVRDRFRVATTVGFGPRFLHSTGQFHKGGPNQGLFLQLTADDPVDLPIPGRSYTFGTLKKAQAVGDLRALRRHRRQVLRVHLGGDIAGGLEALAEVIQRAPED